MTRFQMTRRFLTPRFFEGPNIAERTIKGYGGIETSMPLRPNHIWDRFAHKIFFNQGRCRRFYKYSICIDNDSLSYDLY